MATEKRLNDMSYPAGEDLTDYQFYAVGVNTAGEAILADGDETLAVGILQNHPDDEQAAQVRQDTGSLSKAKYGGVVTVGAWLKASSGKLIVTTTAEDRVLGWAKTAGVLNDIGTMVIEPGYYRGST